MSKRNAAVGFLRMCRIDSIPLMKYRIANRITALETNASSDMDNRVLYDITGNARFHRSVIKLCRIIRLGGRVLS